MQYPSDNQARNVEQRNLRGGGADLERKVRAEQVVKNDAWLRADAVYKDEMRKLRKERDDIAEILQGVQQNMEFVMVKLQDIWEQVGTIQDNAILKGKEE